VVDAGHRGVHGELHPGDLEAFTDLLDRAGRLRVDARGRKACLLEAAAQRHAVARRFGGREQLFGVGSRSVLETRAEAVVAAKPRLPLERACALLQSAL